MIRFKSTLALAITFLIAPFSFAQNSASTEKNSDRYGYHDHKDSAIFQCKLLSLDFEPKYRNYIDSISKRHNSPVLSFQFEVGIDSSSSISLNQQYAGGGVSGWSIKGSNLATKATFIPDFQSMSFMITDERNSDDYFMLTNISFKPDAFKAHSFSDFLGKRAETIELKKVDDLTFKGTLKLSKTTKYKSKVNESTANADIQCFIPESDWAKVRERIEREYGD